MYASGGLWLAPSYICYIHMFGGCLAVECCFLWCGLFLGLFFFSNETWKLNLQFSSEVPVKALMVYHGRASLLTLLFLFI